MTKRGSANTEGNDDLALKSDDASKTETDFDTAKTESEEEYPSTPPSPPSPDPCPYNEKEKVLALHGSKIYEAKVVQVGFQIAEKQWVFKVHYMRWSHKWDEWVGVDRLMKDTEANRHRQLVNNNKQDEEMQMIPSYHAGRGRKRKNNSRNQEKRGIQMENSVNIQIPPKLKKQLVGDCNFVKRLRKLVKLPREPNVNDILEEYRDYMTMIEEQASETTGEIVKGLRSYFDKALPAILLYENEREQYEDSVATDVSPSSVYGAEHLLRLFVKLPELMVHANIEGETLTLLQEKLVGFLKFLQNHRTMYFLWPVHDESKQRRR